MRFDGVRSYGYGIYLFVESAHRKCIYMSFICPLNCASHVNGSVSNSNSSLFDSWLCVCWFFTFYLDFSSDLDGARGIASEKFEIKFNWRSWISAGVVVDFSRCFSHLCIANVVSSIKNVYFYVPYCIVQSVWMLANRIYRLYPQLYTL